MELLALLFLISEFPMPSMSVCPKGPYKAVAGSCYRDVADCRVKSLDGQCPHGFDARAGKCFNVTEPCKMEQSSASTVSADAENEEKVEEDEEEEWGYGPSNGPSTWSGTCRTGTRQSPIDISRSGHANQTKGSLNFHNYNASGNVVVENNGHSVMISGFDQWTTTARPFIDGAGIGIVHKYLLQQIHFHWNDRDNGSEHSIDGVHFPVEAHLVHIREDLSLLSTAQNYYGNYRDGLAVVAIFLQRGSGTALANLEALLPKLINYENKVDQTNFTIGSVLPADKSVWYRYLGSLTTPECTEAVMWVVLHHPAQISQNQLSLLRKVHGSDGKRIASNQRPTQHLGDRIVEKFSSK